MVPPTATHQGRKKAMRRRIGIIMSLRPEKRKDERKLDLVGKISESTMMSAKGRAEKSYERGASFEGPRTTVGG